jgi:hypothetical protein
LLSEEVFKLKRLLKDNGFKKYIISWDSLAQKANISR